MFEACAKLHQNSKILDFSVTLWKKEGSGKKKYFLRETSIFDDFYAPVEKNDEMKFLAWIFALSCSWQVSS